MKIMKIMKKARSMKDYEERWKTAKSYEIL